MRYLQIYPDGKHYMLNTLTKYHKEGTKENYWIICDLKENKDLIGGQWSKKLKVR